MKKILSVLSVIAILGMATPVMAAPGGGPGGHGRHGGGPGVHGGPHGGHRIHAGAPHHRHIRPHGGITVHTGHYPRHSYWRSYGPRYWGGPWCDYRLGWYDTYYPCRPHTGVYFPVGGAGVSIRF